MTEIAEARHMKENADKHVTLLVFYSVLGIFSWANDAKKKLILCILNFSWYSSDICLKIQMLKPSSEINNPMSYSKCQPHAAPYVTPLQIISILQDWEEKQAGGNASGSKTQFFSLPQR